MAIETLSLILFQGLRSQPRHRIPNTATLLPAGTGRRLKPALALAALFLTAFPASALSVNDFERQTRNQQTDYVLKAVDKIVAEVAKADPALARAIHDYFEVTPAGQKQPPGLMAFAASLGAIEELAGKGKFDLDKVQIEGILLDVIKTTLMNKQPEKK
jgi:hypothetical protein